MAALISNEREVILERCAFLQIKLPLALSFTTAAIYELMHTIVWPKATFFDWFANMTIDKFHAYQRLNILI